MLRRAVLVQAGLPVLPEAILAMLTGLAVTTGLLPRGLPPPAVLLPGAAALVAVLAAACTLPALRAAAGLEQLRTG